LTGWAGLVFLIMEKENYFMLEVGAMCKLARAVDGKREFLAQSKKCSI